MLQILAASERPNDDAKWPNGSRGLALWSKLQLYASGVSEGGGHTTKLRTVLFPNWNIFFIIDDPSATRQPLDSE